MFKKSYIDISGAKKKQAKFENEVTFSCPKCLTRITATEKMQNNDFCPKCSYYYVTSAWDRIHDVCDENSFEEWNAHIKSLNPLNFPNYEKKMIKAREETGLTEAIVTGRGSIGGYDVVLGAMDSRFMMGSMGSAVGEKISRAMEKAIQYSLPCIMFSSSGGARMQEGMLSLMQMAKTSASVGRLREAGLLYISILTHPTTGGVTASFASLADVIIAESGALVGFTGPRVIEQTTGHVLPPGFQRSEYLLKHGMVDLVQPRAEMRSLLIRLLNIHQGENYGEK
ncbi:MAG: acetyl-CoA carboxylase, carboxyltransferase subunit beta [Syntrophomonas sp.]|nr:acetyl-CoA carboxylase, carboxyltransferase subunit beta [Syntrophomonas sp.]